MSERWDNHFLQLALDHARMSKDPSTRVGAIIVGPDREIVSAGFNGLPRDIADTHERPHDRETKLRLVVHAEMNAILAAARLGHAVKGCTLYLAATDDSGIVWAARRARAAPLRPSKPASPRSSRGRRRLCRAAGTPTWSSRAPSSMRRGSAIARSRHEDRCREGHRVPPRLWAGRSRQGDPAA